MHPKLAEVAARHERTRRLPSFRVGDKVRVMMKIREGDRQRLQSFEGVVIRKRGGGVQATFTVRRVAYGEGIEKSIPLHAPTLDSIKVMQSASRVRRAQLGYLRRRSAKETQQAIA